MDFKKNIYDNKLIVIICAIVLSAIGIVSLVYNNSNNSVHRVSSKDIKKVYDDKKTILLYVEDSNSNNCKKCDEVKNYLDSKKVDYVLYDVSKSGDKDYKKMLDVYGIDINSFKKPALLYIKDGNMYSNIINISNTGIIDQFLKDNKLI